MEHLNANNILINEQFGFRTGHSCEAQLISVVEDLTAVFQMSGNVFEVMLLLISFVRSIVILNVEALINLVEILSTPTAL